MAQMHVQDHRMVQGVLERSGSNPLQSIVGMFLHTFINWGTGHIRA